MKELYKALADFQQEVPNIYKNATGYGYKFADLGQINEIIKPLLKKHGLGYTQPLDGTSLKTIIFHVESGESLEGSVEIPQDILLAKMNAFQVIGSGITYYRRYSLSSILGLITDEDADAVGTQVKAKTIDEPKECNTGIPVPSTDSDVLARAKTAINEKLVEQGYDRADSKRKFISVVLEKETIDNLDDADLVMDALENEAVNDNIRDLTE